MAARLGLLRAEGRTEGIHLAQCHGRGFNVELAGLRQKRFFVEVVDREQSAGAFAGRGREDGRIGQNEAALVEKVTRGAYDLSSYPQDGALARRAHPAVAVLHEEVDPLPLAGGWERLVFGNALRHADIPDVELV